MSQPHPETVEVETRDEGNGVIAVDVVSWDEAPYWVQQEYLRNAAAF